MELNQLKELLGKIAELPSPKEKEETIFGIGARGHFENPTTDVLAFFLDNNASHGLGNAALEALLELLPDDVSSSLSANLINTPEREVASDNGNRIDLLMESDEWLLVLENKIFHTQNNPFDDYQAFAKQRYPSKEHIYVVLSPSGEAPSGWYGISYPALINTLKEKLATCFISQPMNKWLVLLREFILHLEQLMTNGSEVSEQTSEFVLEHLDEIQRVQELKDRVINSLQFECKSFLEEKFNGKEVKTRLHSWSGFPALRFSLAEWQTESDVVLHFGRGEHSVVHAYIFRLDSPEQYKAAQKVLVGEECSEHWTEKKDTIAAFRTPLAGLDKDSMFKTVARRMELVDRFEREVRSQW
jgi:hypothetical protein